MVRKLDTEDNEELVICDDGDEIQAGVDSESDSEKVDEQVRRAISSAKIAYMKVMVFHTAKSNLGLVNMTTHVSE